MGTWRQYSRSHPDCISLRNYTNANLLCWSYPPTVQTFYSREVVPYQTWSRPEVPYMSLLEAAVFFRCLTLMIPVADPKALCKEVGILISFQHVKRLSHKQRTCLCPATCWWPRVVQNSSSLKTSTSAPKGQHQGLSPMALVSMPLIKHLALKISSLCIPSIRSYFFPDLPAPCIAQLPCLPSLPHDLIPPIQRINLGSLQGGPTLHTDRTEALVRHPPRGGWCQGSSASQLSCSWCYRREQERELCNGSESLPSSSFTELNSLYYN